MSLPFPQGPQAYKMKFSNRRAAVLRCRIGQAVAYRSATQILGLSGMAARQRWMVSRASAPARGQSDSAESELTKAS